MRTRRRAASLLACFFLFFAFNAWAADTNAKIRGTITDPNGALVPNVTVTATNQATGISYSAVSQANGTYQFLSLPVGTYKVSASAPGFQTFTATGITLVIDQQYVQDISFKVGQASETVEVQANAVQVDTTNIQLSNVVDSKQVVDLPLIGRNFTQLEQLFPGVQSSSDRFGTFSANGAQTQQTSFLVNGTDINDAPLNTAVVIPSPDAVQQFNLVTSSLNPEYSRNSGAIVSVNIKSGTNAFHGSAFDFYRDTFLNTANFFQNKKHIFNLTTGAPAGPGAPKFHQNIFGGTVGGPAIKDKAFFFLSYQGLRAIQPQTGGNVNVFTPAQLGGDFTGASFSSNVIPSSITIPGCPAGTKWNACAASLGNKFPVSAFNPVSTKLVNMFVPAASSGSSFIFNPTTQSVQDQGIMKFDVTPNQNNSFYFVGIIQHAPSSDTLPFTGATLPGFGDHNERETHQFTAAYTHAFNLSTLNEFRLGYTRFNFQAVLPQTNLDPASLGFSIIPQQASSSQLPVIAVGGFFTLGFSTNGPQPRIDQTYQIDDNFSKVWGNHTLKFGWDGRRFNVDNPFFNSVNGSYSFSPNNNFSSGNAGLDFLLGNASTYSQGSGAVINARAYENYLYFQDQWKYRPNLTLTFGAGWQIDSPWYNQQYQGHGVTCFLPGQQSTLFPTAPAGLDFSGDQSCNNGQGAKVNWKHIGPRFGFAYAPNLGFLSGGESHKLAIRGGYGIYFNRTEEEGSLQNLGDPPFGITTAGIGDLGGNPQFANPFADINGGITPSGQSIGTTAIANKFPFVPATPGSNVDFSFFEPFILSQYSSHYTMPYSQNFQLTIERELPSNIVAGLTYVGALGRHEQITVEGNPITQAGHDACLASPSCIANRTLQGLFFPSHSAFGNSDVFSSIGEISSIGNSNYNALQLSARKGTTHGLLFQASYTYSHSLDNGSSFENSGFGGSARGFNLYLPSLNYGDSQFDARHRFVFSPIYQIPNWKHAAGLHWLPDVIGKGWGISAITTLASGFPFDILTGGSNSLFCSSGLQFYQCPEVPLQVGQLQRMDPRTPVHLTGTPTASATSNAGYFWFNPQVGVTFDREQIGSFGNTHRNPFHGPGINNTDMIIMKNIDIPGERGMYVQLRLESYNVFNHTQFNLPTSSLTFSTTNPALPATITNTAGQITGAAAGRQSQLAIKFYF